MTTSVCIVGASLSGFRTAVALRKQGFAGEIRIIGAEKHMPYDRPPLSKSMLMSQTVEPARWLTTDSELAALAIDLTLGVRATGLRQRADGWRVDLDDGEYVNADIVVVATGAVARQPLRTDLSGIHTLRTLDDHYALHSALSTARNVVAVGGGFIACEVAAAARARGVSATVVEALSQPLARVLGDEVGATCAALLRHNEVDVVCRQSVTGILGEHGRAAGVRLTENRTIRADVVLVGVGVRPATDWLASSPLDLGDGVLCDQYGAAAGVSGVFAVGDSSRWWHPLAGTAIRVEHWSNVAEQALVVASNIVQHRSRVLASVPYVWSDQFGKKLQITGWPSPECSIYWIEEPDNDFHCTALYGANGTLVAAFAVDDPRFVAQARRMISDRETIGTAVDRITRNRNRPHRGAGGEEAPARRFIGVTENHELEETS